MKESLNKLKALLTDVIPEVIDSLNPGASDDAIQLAEKVIGFDLPENVRELYRLHNGQSGNSGLFFGLPFLSLEEALREWQLWSELAEERSSILDADIISIPPNHIREVYANKGYFPISKDGGGNNLVIDMDPDIDGKKGQVINCGRDEAMRYVIAEDIAGFLQFIISQLENKNFRVEREEGYADLFLKTPANAHFMDTLKDLELPFGVESETTEPLSPDFEAWFEGLGAAWKNYLNAEFGTLTSWEALQKIKSLSLLGYEFAEIAPLTAFTGLRELILSGNPILDFSPLNALQNLQKLYLAKTAIRSIDAIPELPHLVQLNLFDSKIETLQEIDRFPTLKSLGIGSTPVRDLTEIGKLQNLIELDLSNSECQSFEPLRSLKRLKQLDLSYTNFKDLAIIGNLVKLDSLKIHNTKVTGFEALETLSRLSSITCNFEQFLQIKQVLKHDIHFTIAGRMSKKQEKIWHTYNSDENGFNREAGTSNFWMNLFKKWF